MINVHDFFFFSEFSANDFPSAGSPIEAFFDCDQVNVTEVSDLEQAVEPEILDIYLIWRDIW